MSTDATLHVEIKVDGQWRHYTRTKPERNYWMFSRMAGVRDRCPAIAPERGIPDDATFETRFEYEQYIEDIYSPTWLDRSDIHKLHGEYETRYRDLHQDLHQDYDPSLLYFEEWLGTYLYGSSFTDIKLPRRVTDLRFVVWFD